MCQPGYIETKFSALVQFNQIVYITERTWSSPSLSNPSSATVEPNAFGFCSVTNTGTLKNFLRSQLRSGQENDDVLTLANSSILRLVATTAENWWIAGRKRSCISHMKKAGLIMSWITVAGMVRRKEDVGRVHELLAMRLPAASRHRP